MDEGKISQLFQDAVRDVPPPTFGGDDVTAESARLNRRRTGIITGSALALVVLAGGATAVVALSGSGSSGNNSVAAAPMATPDSNETTAPNEVPSDAPRIAAGSDSGSPSATPKQGGSPGGEVGPGADGTQNGCGPADRELAAALAGELPSAVSHTDPQSSPLACPAGSRSAAMPITDGPRRGIISIMLTPKGTAQVQQPPWGDRQNAEGIVVVAKSGATLVLSVEGVRGSVAPPVIGEQLKELADKVAKRY
ncbi:hypothetical protein [Actinokineospora enzanensis]|uniref:hypothetical protein n=1 Tax=Actinokineospora enzanensis TaxID=155975 RepID=UPI000360B01D|nr:hypothetical protein [Actinokineospora enzanensis]